MKFLINLLFICITCFTHALTDDRQPWQNRVDIFQPFFQQTHRYRDTRSVDREDEDKKPLAKIFVDVPLPLGIARIKDLQQIFGLEQKPERRRRQVRRKREALIANSASKLFDNNPGLVKSNIDSNYGQSFDSEVRLYSNPILELPTRLAESKEDPRKRRNSSINDHEDDREKRMFSDIDMRDGRNIRESTTKVPAWKKPKDGGPQFVTTSFAGPQHRSGEGARESHSLKDFDKSNEIPRSLQQDNYYSATNRRASNSRNVDLNLNTPPSVYDTYDYNNSRRGYSRLADDRRPVYDNYPLSYSRTFSYPPRYYDSRYYYPGAPAPSGEILGRGVEYYHRNLEPSSGRVIYYANLPEPNGRGYDPRYPYPVYSGYSGHSSVYDYRPYSDGYTRNGRNVPGINDPFRSYYDNPNRTYVIYDSDDRKPYNGNGRSYPTYPQTFPNYQYPYRSPWLPGNSLIKDQRFAPDVQIPLTIRTRDIPESKKV